MFRTIGRTWNLLGRSWKVLQGDRELLAFPLMQVVAIAIVGGLWLLIALATGSLDAAVGTEDPVTGEVSRNIELIDIIVLVLATVSLYFVAIFFNAALVSAAIERLRGGDPSVGSGLRATVPHIHNILGWSIIAASVGLILSFIRSETNNLVGRIVISIVGGIWAYLTFFVVPVLVVQGVTPWEAIHRSSSLFKRTWGEQVTSNFGFGLIYVVAAVIVFAPAAALFVLNPIAGIIAGVILVALAFSVVTALEGIFKAALYQYATEGAVPAGFEDSGLSSAYGPRG